MHSREKDDRYPSSYHSYRDRSPEMRDARERHSPGRGTYRRERHHGDKYYIRGSSPGHIYRNSPGKERDTMPLQRISRNKSSTDMRERMGKFSRYDSRSEEDESDNNSTLSGLESEEEVEEEVEVTASESEVETEESQSKVGLKEGEKEASGNIEQGKFKIRYIRVEIHLKVG